MNLNSSSKVFFDPPSSWQKAFSLLFFFSSLFDRKLIHYIIDNLLRMFRGFKYYCFFQRITTKPNRNWKLITRFIAAFYITKKGKTRPVEWIKWFDDWAFCWYFSLSYDVSMSLNILVTFKSFFMKYFRSYLFIYM